MADLRIKTGTSSVAHGNSDGTMVDVRGTRDGAMFTAPWLTALALEGRCFGMNTALQTTPDSWGLVYSATVQAAYISVPSGTTIIPVFIEITFEDTDTGSPGGAIDCMATLSDVYDSSPGGTAVVAYNMRTDAPIKSNCTCKSITSSGTTPYTGNFLEFWRGTAGMMEDSFAGTTAATSELNTRTTWSVGEAMAPPVIVGEGSLNVYIGKPSNTKFTGFITIIWAEVPSNSIKG